MDRGVGEERAGCDRLNGCPARRSDPIRGDREPPRRGEEELGGLDDDEKEARTLRAEDGVAGEAR